MFKKIPRIALLSIAKKVIVFGLVCYAGVASVLLLRLKPQTLIIGIDQYGTRIVREPGDRLLKKEKENFLKRFLALQYGYDTETFEKRISDSGDLMADQLWTEKRAEFDRIAKQLKTEDLTQEVQVTELREVDDWTYQADLALKIRRKLTESAVKLRVELRIRPNPRRENNPYPYEVERYDEQQAL